MNAKKTHWLVCRLELGGNSGPGSGWAGTDRVQVMSAHRSKAAAERKQRELGGWVEEASGPLAKYSQNETIRHAK